MEFNMNKFKGFAQSIKTAAKAVRGINVKDALVLGGTALLALSFVGLIGLKIASALHTEQATIVVTKKERLVEINDGNSKFTHNVETTDDLYTVRDTWLKWHFRSATTYSQIQVGTCNVTLQGYRLGFLSMKKNIIKANCTGVSK